MRASRDGLNARQRRTLERVFSLPTPSGITWAEVERLLIGLGVVLEFRGGSRVRAFKGERVFTIHIPHPRKECSRAMIRDIRDFLRAIDVGP